MHKKLYIPCVLMIIISIMCFFLVVDENPLASDFMDAMVAITGHVFGATFILAVTQ